MSTYDVQKLTIVFKNSLMSLLKRLFFSIFSSLLGNFVHHLSPRFIHDWNEKMKKKKTASCWINTSRIIKSFTLISRLFYDRCACVCTNNSTVHQWWWWCSHLLCMYSEKVSFVVLKIINFRMHTEILTHSQKKSCWIGCLHSFVSFQNRCILSVHKCIAGILQNSFEHEGWTTHS